MRRQPTRTEQEELTSWYIANCVLNALLAITAIIFNSVTIQALRRTSSLSKPLRTLLLSLAVSDLGVGLLVQPLLVVLLFKWLRMNTENSPTCAAYTAFTLFGTLCSSASFFGVMALSADRFLAIHLHLRYQELVTHIRVVSAVVSSWVFSAILSFLRLFISSIIAGAILASIGVTCLVASAVFYCKIYVAVRRHRNEIHTLQVQQPALNAEMAANYTRSRKSAVGTFHVYLVFLICYFPLLCIFAVTPSSGRSNITLLEKKIAMSSWTLVFLNSSLNPVIYCWKMRHIRRAIMDILRNVFPSHS